MRRLIVLISGFLIVSLSVLALVYSGEAKVKIPLGTAESSQNQTLTVTKVIDGNTIKLSNGEEVRLIGVDFSDSKKGKATLFMKQLVEGKQVRLEYDARHRDKDGQLLAYVYDVQTYKDMRDILSPIGFELVGNQVFVNATLIKSGYAEVMYDPPNVKYVDLYLKLQKEAKDNKRGIWTEVCKEGFKQEGKNCVTEKKDYECEGSIRRIKDDSVCGYIVDDHIKIKNYENYIVEGSLAQGKPGKIKGEIWESYLSCNYFNEKPPYQMSCPCGSACARKLIDLESVNILINDTTG